MGAQIKYSDVSGGIHWGSLPVHANRIKRNGEEKKEATLIVIVCCVYLLEDMAYILNQTLKQYYILIILSDRQS